MSEKTSTGQSGGITNFGTMNAGNIGGRDVNVTGPAPLDDVLRPVKQAIEAAQPGVRVEAAAKFSQLRTEVAKSRDANDGVMAKLIDGLVDLVPSATSAIVSAFGTPLLGALSGPVTAAVLAKLRSE